MPPVTSSTRRKRSHSSPNMSRDSRLGSTHSLGKKKGAERNRSRSVGENNPKVSDRADLSRRDSFESNKQGVVKPPPKPLTDDDIRRNVTSNIANHPKLKRILGRNVEINLAHYPKLKQVLGNTLTVQNQRDVGKVLAENTLHAFLGGLTQVGSESLEGENKTILLESQAAMREALRLLRPGKIEELTQQHVPSPANAARQNETDFPWVTQGEIQTLLSSTDSQLRAAGEKVMSALFNLCKYPKVIATGFENGGMAPIRDNLQSGQALDQTQNQTNFIKWMRASLTTTYFQSALMVDLQAAVDNLPGNVRNNKSIIIKDYIANIGFNRLMSSTNLEGASLSSDVDFKLVIDRAGLAEELDGLDPEGRAVSQIVETMQRVLKNTQEKFSAFDMSLEVKNFTLKSLSQIEKQLRNIEEDGDPAELNFSATVFNNQTLMSGSAGIQEKYKTIIKDAVGNRLASLTWEQNLGESDKGSMEIISALPKFERVLSDIGKIIESDSNLKAITRQLVSGMPKFGEVLLRRDSQTPMAEVASNPEVLAALLKDDYFRNALLIKPEIVGEAGILSTIPFFQDDGSANAKAKKLSLIAKLTKDFTVDNSRNFIGRPDLNENSDWIYSVKFVGCRLFDMFDQTTLDDYRQAWRESREASDGEEAIIALDSEINEATISAKYNDGKQIATAINAFAVQLQNRIYEWYGLRGEARKPHEEIDALYPRITANEFSGMLDESEFRPKLIHSLETLLKDLEPIPANESKVEQMSGILASDIRQIKLVTEVLKTSDSVNGKLLGLNLFDAMFKLSSLTAQAVKPPIH